MLLPNAFAELEPLAQAGWCLNTETERTKKRRTSPACDLQNFYDVMRPHLERALAHLDSLPLNDLPVPDRNLLNLTLSMAEVAFAVEKYAGNPSGFSAISASRFVPVHDSPSGAASKPTVYKPDY